MGDSVGIFIIIFSAALFYLLPSIIANSRKHKNKNSICVINIFFGWTILGWVVCLAWSVSSNVETATA